MYNEYIAVIQIEQFHNIRREQAMYGELDTFRKIVKLVRLRSSALFQFT